VTLIRWFSFDHLYEDNTRIDHRFGDLGLENHIGFFHFLGVEMCFFWFFRPKSRFSKKEGSVDTYSGRPKNDPPSGPPWGILPS